MSEPAGEGRNTRRGFGMTAALCAVFVAAMVGVTFASSPLYSIFCQVTGYGGTTRKAESGPEGAIDRMVTVRFDANIANGLGWSFRPLERSIKVRVGEVAEVHFRAENRGSRTTTGTAAFNVTPGETGAYFNKIACFCFTDRTLAPGEVVDLPVTFFVDPAMAGQRELDPVDTITLSYTFFPAATPAKPVAAAAPAATGNAL